MQVLIPLGGNGTRLKEITKEKIPKGFLFFNGEPLLAYHMKMFIKAGITKFILDFDRQEYIDLFNKYKSEGLIPKAEIITNRREIPEDGNYHDVPFASFLSKDIKKAVSVDDTIFLLSDIFFYYRDLILLIKSYCNSCSSIFATYEWTDVNMIVGISNPPIWAGLAIFSKSDACHVIDAGETYYCPTDIQVIDNIEDKGGKPCFIKLSKCVNINTRVDYNYAKVLFEKLEEEDVNSVF